MQMEGGSNNFREGSVVSNNCGDGCDDSYNYGSESEDLI